MKFLYIITIGYPTTCKANGKGKHFVKVNVQDCKFPFIYDGKRYNGCTTTGTKYGPWCATKLDSKGNYVKDNWARCNKHCKTDQGLLQFFNISTLKYNLSIFTFYIYLLFVS